MKRYIHGSEDSLDLDVFYVFDTMPTFTECQALCSAHPDENRNIIAIKDGIVTHCFKGTIDEINNALYHTYSLHEQIFPNPIEKLVERDILIKMIRVIRGILSHCSRTHYRTEVKIALGSPSWKVKTDTLRSIDFSTVTMNFGRKKGSKEDILKTFAFQIGQFLGLMSGIELYTKSSIANQYSSLKKYLYRESGASLEDIIEHINIFLTFAESYEIIESDQTTYFPRFNKTIDLVKEKYVPRTEIKRFI